jgi:2-polyprenyl-3-methyl-5-hydroxy-6-metoxy-1,4-benzoquinol methylase
MAIDPKKMEQLMGRMVGDIGAAAGVALVLLGDELGLYKALAAAGPCNSADLATRTGCAERYVREWLAQQAASGYVQYDAASGRFSMSPEQAAVFADESSPAFIPGAFEMVISMIRDEPRLSAAFRSGQGVGWHEHDASLFRSVERFFRPGYAAHLIGEWIPALEGMEAKLRAGAKVADVGCGHGVTTVLMARAFPASTFVGFDYHRESIERARQIARESDLKNVSFEIAMAKDYPGTQHDLVTFFDCLHDMGDPVGAATHVRRSLKPDGVFMLVEPRAGDRLEENLNPVGRIFYAASTMFCTPASLSQEVGLALGAQAGEKRMREVTAAAGFTHFRRAAETPFNAIYEVRP